MMMARDVGWPACSRRERVEEYQEAIRRCHSVLHCSVHWQCVLAKRCSRKFDEGTSLTMSALNALRIPRDRLIEESFRCIERCPIRE